MTSFIIFSVCQNSPWDNENTFRVGVRLDRKEIAYKSIIGVYEGKKEKSFLIPYNRYNLDLVRSLAREFEQDSILVVKDGLGKLLFTDGRLPLELGQWTSITNRKGLKGYSVIDGQVYTCVKG